MENAVEFTLHFASIIRRHLGSPLGEDDEFTLHFASIIRVKTTAQDGTVT